MHCFGAPHPQGSGGIGESHTTQSLCLAQRLLLTFRLIASPLVPVFGPSQHNSESAA